jgi:hypothetical protein
MGVDHAPSSRSCWTPARAAGRRGEAGRPASAPIAGTGQGGGARSCATGPAGRGWGRLAADLRRADARRTTTPQASASSTDAGTRSGPRIASPSTSALTDAAATIGSATR